jgi:hypothetical protein
MTSPAFGVTIKQENLDASFLTGPGEDLVPKLMSQMALVPQFITLFGPYIVANNQQRWAEYQRYDWNIRQLPAINVFEAQSEEKDSDNAFLNGTVSLQIFWPPNQRREDLRRVQATMKGIIENFFSSQYVRDMLDELYYIQRPAKVYGLNEFGKNLTWTPNVEGISDGEQVPVTLIDVRYRIDLRAWYRALEYLGRTKDNPFEVTLSDLTVIGGEYDGVTSADGSEVSVVVLDEINVSNP